MINRTPAPPTRQDRAVANAIVAGVGLPDVPDHWPAPSDPMATARRVLAERFSEGEQFTLRFWRGSWMTWRRSHWAEVEPVELAQTVYELTETATYLVPATERKPEELRPWRPNKPRVAHVVDALTALTLVPGETDAPSWIDGLTHPPAGEVIGMSNGLLEVCGRRLLPHTTGLFNVVGLPFAYEPNPPPPHRWLAFLRSLWPEDDEAIALLQEWCGLAISGRTALHKLLLLVGPPRAGKGTIVKVLSALMGRGNCVSPTLSSLGGSFGLQPLIGKSLATIGDARLSTRTDTASVVDRLLTISGEDPITIDRKFLTSWHGTLGVRFLIVSNELPRFTDSSGAIASRFSVLLVNQSFLGHETIGLAKSLLEELPAIFSWALEGLDRLTERGGLTEPQSSIEAVSELHDLTSPTGAFIRERCENGGSVSVDDLFDAWQQWAFRNGHPPGSSTTFGRDLRAARPDLAMTRTNTGGKRERRYVGMHLVPVEAPKPSLDGYLAQSRYPSGGAS